VDKPNEVSLDVEYQFMPLARLALLRHPANKTQAILFHNNLLAVIDDSCDKGFIVQEKREIAAALEPPRPDLSNLAWGVDAALLNPKIQGETHLFCGEKYMCVKIDTEKNPLALSLTRGPFDVVDKWTCLAEAGFTRIDATLQVPTTNGKDSQVWFFKGDKVIRASWTQENDGSIESAKIEGPSTIVDKWRCLDDIEFTTVNMALPHFRDVNKAWFFSGERYALISIDPKTLAFTVERPPRNIAEDWPNSFYVPPEFPTIPTFDDTEVDSVEQGESKNDEVS